MGICFFKKKNHCQINTFTSFEAKFISFYIPIITMLKQALFIFLFFIINTVVSQELTVTQKFPETVTPGGEYIVEIRINQNTPTEFMKFFQDVPAGFVATEIESKGGGFSFADGGAKIVWLTPPADKEFTISYKVTVPQNESGIKNIGGKLAYMINNERKIVEFETKTIKIETQLVAVPSTPVVVKEEIKTVVPDQLDTVSTIPPPSIPVVKEEIKTIVTPPIIKEEPKAVVHLPKSDKVPVTAIPVSAGKTFRVQIGAFNLTPTIKGVPEPSKILLDNGMTKYFSGNFKTYEEAAKRKRELIEKGFQGAFIVSFENGHIVK